MSTDTMHWYGVANNSSEPVKPSLSPSHRAMAYGDGFFTTMGVQAGEVLWQAYHQRRIIHHATALKITLTSSQLSNLWIQVARYGAHIDHGLIKIIVARQPQALRGYGFASDAQSSGGDIWLGVLATEPTSIKQTSINSASTTKKTTIRLVASEQMYPNTSDCSIGLPDSLYDTSIAICSPIMAVSLSAQISCVSPSLVGLKTLNRLDTVMAAAELQQRKLALASSKATYEYEIGEGLVKDIQGTWVEGTMSNVFYRLRQDKLNGGEQWYTPPIDRSGVNGVMRQVIMDKLKSSKTPVIERRLLDEDLVQLSAMSFCNAVRGVVPVAGLILPNHEMSFL